MTIEKSYRVAGFTFRVTADVALRDSRALADKWLENGVLSQ